MLTTSPASREKVVSCDETSVELDKLSSSADYQITVITIAVYSNLMSRSRPTTRRAWTCKLSFCNRLYCLCLGLCQISAPGPANLESSRFLAKSISSVISSRIWGMPVQLQYVQLIMEKSNAADLSRCVFAILISVTPMKKKHNSLSFHKFCQKLANSNVMKKSLNCIATL